MTLNRVLKGGATEGMALLFSYTLWFGVYQRTVGFDLLFTVTPIVGVCNCSMSCYTLLYVHSSFAIILMGKKELVAWLNLYS